MYTYIHKTWWVGGWVSKDLSSSDIQALYAHEDSDAGITHIRMHPQYQAHTCTYTTWMSLKPPYSSFQAELDSKAKR